MYDELITKIRHCATDPMHCLSCGEDKDGRCFERLMKQAADAIEELQEDNAALNGTVTNLLEQIKELGKPRWIPVTEQLPDKFQPVWVACKMDGRENWTFDTVYDPYRKCPWGTYYLLEKGEAVAYAWMDRSAPEPPKEGTK